MANNRRMTVTRASLTCLVALLCQPVVAQDEQNKGLYGAPARLSTPDDWQKLAKLTKLTKLQVTEVILSWLIEERKSPSPTITGMGGGPIDSDYTQAQIIHSFASADPKILTWLVRSGSIKSAPMQALLGMALAYTGDLSAKSYMIGALQSNPNPYLREKAALFLTEWQGSDVVEALERAAATDPFHLRFEKAHGTPGIYDNYPVRVAAASSLAVLARGAKPNEWSEMRLARYKEGMEGYDEFVKANKSDLERLAKLVNTDKPARRRRSE